MRTADGPDTALARRLLEKGALDLPTLQSALEEVRRQRLAAPAATLAAHLRERGLVDTQALEATEQALSSQSLSGSSMSLGSLVDGIYRLDHLLGEGGMGRVFSATDTRLDKPVALKLLHLDAASEEGLARFERETELAARLDRKGGLVRVHAAGTHKGLPYFVMERVEGHDLARELRDGALEPMRLARILEEIARTLADCHAEGVVHRDLKPGNVLIRAEDDAPLVTDFGIARSAGNQRLTLTGELIGTPAYMAPEQARDSARATEPTVDVYALGAILYHGLSGRPPFEGGVLQVLSKLGRVPPPPPRTVRAEADPDLEAICLRAMALDPAARYPSAAELADHLARYRAGESLAARARPRAALAGVGLLVPLLLVTLVLLTRDSPPNLAEHHAWEQAVLTPYLERLGEEGLSAPAVADLQERARALQSLGGDSEAVSMSLRRLESARKAAELAKGSVLPTGANGDPELERYLAVLAQEASGETREAIDGLLALGRKTPGARAVATRLLCARNGEITRGWLQSERGHGQLERLLADARRLEVDPGALRESKRAALAESAGAWEAALLDSVKSEREANTLARLVELCRLSPPVDPPQPLRAVLSRTFKLLHETRNADFSEGKRYFERLLAWDSLWFGLDRGVSLPPKYRQRLGHLWQVNGHKALKIDGPELLVFLWRNTLIDDGNLDDNLAEFIRLRKIDLGALEKKHPGSSAVAFLRWAIFRKQCGDEGSFPQHLDELVVSGRAVLDAPDKDLGDVYVGEVLAELAGFEQHILSRLRSARATDAAWDARWESALTTARKARTLTPNHKLLLLSWSAESELLEMRGRTEEQLALWERATAHLRDNAQEGRLQVSHEYLRRAYFERGQVLRGCARKEEALAAYLEACELLPDGSQAPAEARVVELLRGLDRRDEAQVFLDRLPSERLVEPELLREGVRLYLDLKSPKKADALLRTARTQRKANQHQIDLIRREELETWLKAQGKGLRVEAGPRG